jgi:hypothetical protein
MDGTGKTHTQQRRVVQAACQMVMTGCSDAIA